MAREFKVGQVVTIRQWDDMEREYGLKEKESVYSCDNIKVPGAGFTEPMKELCGKKATILKIEHMAYRNHDRITLDFHDKELKDTSWYYTTDMIEIEQYIPTFEELVGKVVEIRDGRRYLGVKTTNEGIIFTGIAGWFAAKDRGADLLSKYGKELDIMKVYEPKYGYYFSGVLDSENTLIWERKEVEEVKEMTIADVEKLVGCKVKVVKD